MKIKINRELERIFDSHDLGFILDQLARCLQRDWLQSRDVEFKKECERKTLIIDNAAARIKLRKELATEESGV